MREKSIGNRVYAGGGGTGMRMHAVIQGIDGAGKTTRCRVCLFARRELDVVGEPCLREMYALVKRAVSNAD
jgi:hypothetical protein